MSEIFPCPYRSRKATGHTFLSTGKKVDIYGCKHPENKRRRAVLAICDSCQPRASDPITCERCPWLDPATGEPRAEPLPLTLPETNQPQELVQFVAPPMDKASVRTYPARNLPSPRSPTSRSLAIVSLAAGKQCCAEQAIVLENQKAYARRIGAEFIVRTYPDRRLAYGPAVKYEAAEIAANYDATLLLDTDCVVMAGCPNIFEFVPADHWGLVDERPYLIHTRDALPAQAATARGLGIDKPWLPHLFNSGVLVMPRNAATIYKPERFFTTHWTREQATLSVKLQSGLAPYRSLDPRFNLCVSWHRDFDVQRAWILHRAGQDHSERIVDLRRDVRLARI